jgi:murein DD-endopeptidase MepM/ murein hydrolase activator NlpD
MAELKEKHLEGFPGYVIFFDNIRVDPFVKSFQVNLSCDGSIGSASFDFIYLPDFYKLEKYDPETGDVLSVEDGVENMTNVKVFIKNMFNDKYIMVFDGNIRGKNRTRTPGGYTLTFSAQDYLTWLNRTIVPIAVPQEQSIVAGDRVKWKAQGIDIDNLPGVVPVSEGVFRGKTLTEFIGQMQETTLKTNAFYSSTDGVSYWDGTQNRIKIMGDIDRDLIRNKVIDFTVTSSATFVNSMYVGINDISKNLMFEFYQDRDGYIRIKPPYWNEHVLQDHVIEPLLIMSISENTDWSAYFTRTLVTGGIEEWQEDLNEIDKAFITPCGAYVPYDNPSQDIWSDFNSGNDVVSTVEINKTNDGYTNYFLDSYSRKIRSTPLEPNIGAYKAPREGNLLHSGVDFVMPIGTPVYHRGYPGIAKSGKDRNMGLYIYVDILEGPYKGTPVFYMHLKDKVIKEGGIVTNMQLIGYSGNSGSASHDPYGYLHFQVGPGPTYRENLSRPEDFLLFKAKTDKYIAPVSKTYDPLEYLDKSVGSDNGTVTITSNGDNALLRLSPAEKKYGVSIIDMTQPLVKFTNSRLIDKNSNGIFALRKYAKFLYNITNSMVNMCNVQVMSMPWLRPGFNVWVDPVAVDKVYYIHSLSHHGSAEGGVFTMLNLTLGRERVQYATSSYFGAMGNVAGENLFISQFNMHSYDFGNTIQSNREFNTIKKKCVDFYKNESDAVIIKANQSPYFSTFYKNTNADKSGSTSSSGRLNPGTFAGDYTIDQIQYLLDTAYSTAPAVVKARASKMKRLVDGASSYIRMHYSSEYTK